MKKIIVIGCPGSGKSTFSKQLAKLLNIPLYHMDCLYWKADKTHISSQELRDKLIQIMQQPSWIIDGNFESTLQLRFQQCDTVFFLDYPTEVCIEGVKSRAGKQRSDMPWIEDPVQLDLEFLEFIRNFKDISRGHILELLEKYSHLKIYQFNYREDATQFLNSNFDSHF